MNFQITTLAETMSATEFIIELNERNIDYNIDEMDDYNDANEGDCILSIDDMTYVFANGELQDVVIATI